MRFRARDEKIRLDDSATVAIPKNVLSSSARKGLRGTEPDGIRYRGDYGGKRGAADTQQSEQPEQPERSAETASKPSSLINLPPAILGRVALMTLLSVPIFF